MSKQPTIHDRFTEGVELARTYAEDGAFLSAARVLRDVASDMQAHAEACNRELMEDRS